jgi:hypothetical protein
MFQIGIKTWNKKGRIILSSGTRSGRKVLLKLPRELQIPELVSGWERGLL